MTQLTEGWTWFHWPFRWSYVFLVTPWLQRRLQQAVVSELTLQPRHSVLAKDFNVFRSDLDYSVVFALEPTPQQVILVTEFIDRHRQFLPFLGELEFYTTDEWQQKQALEKRHRELFTLIRSFRKITWQVKAFAQAPSEFHRQKARNALKRIAGVRSKDFELEDIRAAMEQKLKIFLRNVTFEKEIASPDAVQLFSHHLGWEFGTSLKQNDLAVQLTATDCVFFASLLPDGTVAFPEAVEALEELRREPRVREMFSALCRAEWLLCQSVRRQKGEPDSSLEDWVTHLSNLTFTNAAR